MAKKDQTKLKDSISYDYQELAKVQVAAAYLKQGKAGAPFAKRSLEKILEKTGNDPASIKTMTDPRVMSITAENYLNFYNECRNEETVGDLLNYHSERIGREEFAKIKADFGDLSGVTYGEIQKRLKKAEYIVAGEEHNIHKQEDIEKAKKTVERLDKIMKTIDSLDMPRLSKFRAEVETAVSDESIKELYSPKA